MQTKNIAWWTIYIIVAIWLQKLLPGFDAMLPALLVCLYEKNKQQGIIIFIFSILLQEGVGTLPFGASLFWYALVFLCYYLPSFHLLFGSQTYFAVFSAGLIISRTIFVLSMGSLQSLPLDYSPLIFECLTQAVLTPVLWWLAIKTRSSKVSQYAH